MEKKRQTFLTPMQEMGVETTSIVLGAPIFGEYKFAIISLDGLLLLLICTDPFCIF
jgi:hypothetical protein